MPPHPHPANGGEEEEDDYMSMVIEEPQQKETFAQKKLRKQREVRFFWFSNSISTISARPQS
jgi:hypothetical protein